MLVHTSDKEAWAFLSAEAMAEKHERLKNKTSKKALLIIFFLPEERVLL